MYGKRWQEYNDRLKITARLVEALLKLKAAGQRTIREESIHYMRCIISTYRMNPDSEKARAV